MVVFRTDDDVPLSDPRLAVGLGLHVVVRLASCPPFSAPRRRFACFVVTQPVVVVLTLAATRFRPLSAVASVIKGRHSSDPVVRIRGCLPCFVQHDSLASGEIDPVVVSLRISRFHSNFRSVVFLADNAVLVFWAAFIRFLVRLLNLTVRDVFVGPRSALRTANFTVVTLTVFTGKQLLLGTAVRVGEHQPLSMRTVTFSWGSVLGHFVWVNVLVKGYGFGQVKRFGASVTACDFGQVIRFGVSVTAYDFRQVIRFGASVTACDFGQVIMFGVSVMACDFGQVIMFGVSVMACDFGRVIRFGVSVTAYDFRQVIRFGASVTACDFGQVIRFGVSVTACDFGQVIMFGVSVMACDFGRVIKFGVSVMACDFEQVIRFGVSVTACDFGQVIRSDASVTGSDFCV